MTSTKNNIVSEFIKTGRAVFRLAVGIAEHYINKAVDSVMNNINSAAEWFNSILPWGNKAAAISTVESDDIEMTSTVSSIDTQVTEVKDEEGANSAAITSKESMVPSTLDSDLVTPTASIIDLHTVEEIEEQNDVVAPTILSEETQLSWDIESMQADLAALSPAQKKDFEKFTLVDYTDEGFVEGDEEEETSFTTKTMPISPKKTREDEGDEGDNEGFGFPAEGMVWDNFSIQPIVAQELSVAQLQLAVFVASLCLDAKAAHVAPYDYSEATGRCGEFELDHTLGNIYVSSVC